MYAKISPVECQTKESRSVNSKEMPVIDVGSLKYFALDNLPNDIKRKRFICEICSKMFFFK